MKGTIMNALAALAALIFTALPLSAAEVVTYYHNDHLGSPIAATDDTGAVAWQQAYDPWGLKLTSNTDERGYTGNWLDEDTGLADHKARWYTSSIGRFTAIDPVKWHESNIHSFNRYAYSGNNPYTNVDVDGDLFLSFHLNRRDMRTDHAIIAGQIGNVGAKTAMGLHTAGSAVGLVGGTSRSLLKLGLKSAKATKNVTKGVSEKVLNRANHVFGPKALEKHNLGGVLDKFSGDQVKAFQSLEKATQKLASQGKIDGVFESVVKVKGVDVTVRGKVVDGTVNIGTAFIP